MSSIGSPFSSAKESRIAKELFGSIEIEFGCVIVRPLPAPRTFARPIAAAMSSSVAARGSVDACVVNVTSRNPCAKRSR